MCLRRVLVRDLDKPRTVEVARDLLTDDPDVLLDDPSIEVLVEVAGGDEPMHSYLERAIRAGKHVVTANKVVMANHGPELLSLAAEKNVDVYFEAAVGGGIPLISTFRTDLQANRIERVSAVINGTTNYVLGRMASGQLSLEDAVREAQAAGYAEADPTDDVGGFDATYKLAILGSIAYEIAIHPRDIYREGIEGIEPVDFRYARELGYAIKLIAHTQRHPGRVEARVHPAMVPLDHPLAQVEGANNAVFVEGDLVGQVLLVGQGAGGRPTASAVVGDLIDLARSIRRGVQSRPVVHVRRPHRRHPDGRGRDTRVLPDPRRRPGRGAGRDRPGLRRGGGEHLELHPEGRLDPGQDRGDRDHHPPDRRRPPAARSSAHRKPAARARGLMLPSRLLTSGLPTVWGGGPGSRSERGPEGGAHAPSSY